MTAQAHAAAQFAVANVLRPASYTTTAGGTAAIDLTGYEGVCKLVIEVGASGGTTPTLSLGINDSADNSSFAAAANITAPGSATASTTYSVDVDTRRVRRYLQFVPTIAGTSPTWLLSVSLVGPKKYRP
jgi:hypothetical protein